MEELNKLGDKMLINDGTAYLNWKLQILLSNCETKNGTLIIDGYNGEVYFKEYGSYSDDRVGRLDTGDKGEPIIKTTP